MSRALLLPLILSALLSLVGCKRTPATQVEVGPADAGPVLAIAAAADLQFALPEVVTAFRQAHSAAKVEVTFGASGTLLAQIQHGAPFGVYLSADRQYAQELVQSGHAASDAPFTYAIGRLVLWVPKASPLEVEKLGWQTLLQPGVQKIAMANPQHAPYGRAAMAAVAHAGLTAQVQPRLVLGENVGQAAQFVQSGAAQVGIIAHSLAVSAKLREAGRFWEVPAAAHPPLEQAGVVLKQPAQAELARDFVKFFRGAGGRAVLERFGFQVPLQP